MHFKQVLTHASRAGGSIEVARTEATLPVSTGHILRRCRAVAGALPTNGLTDGAIGAIRITVAGWRLEIFGRAGGMGNNRDTGSTQ